MIYSDSSTKSRNRKLICDKAISLFLSKGLLDTSIKEICKEAKLERKTFYNYFEDKFELLDYLYYLLIESIMKQGFSLDDFAEDLSKEELIRNYLRRFIVNLLKLRDYIPFMSQYEVLYGGVTVETLIEVLQEDYDVFDLFSLDYQNEHGHGVDILFDTVLSLSYKLSLKQSDEEVINYMEEMIKLLVSKK